MIIRRNLKISAIWGYSWRRIVYAGFVATTALILAESAAPSQALLPYNAVSALGTALAIFLAFRNNSSYDRWWEARKLWGALINASRVFARQVLTFALAPASKEEGLALQEEQRRLLYRQIGYCHALRLQLRLQKTLMEETLTPFLSEDERQECLRSPNTPNLIMLKMGQHLQQLYRAGRLNDFMYMQLDKTLTEFLEIQGGCERIKNTPLPRQYDFYPRIFVYFYVTLFPFTLVIDLGLLTPLVTLPVSFLFFALEGIGHANEDPFENRIQDTPLTALCRTIEISLRDMLGERDLPPAVQPIDGYLM